MIFAQQSTAYEAVYESGITGLVGIVSVMVVDNQGNIVTAASTLNITEQGTTGVYTANRVSPADNGQFTVIWSLDGTFDDGTNSIEDLIVSSSTSEPLPPLPPIGIAGAPAFGPCSAWTTSDEVAECCSAEVGSMTTLFDDAVSAATEVLWLLSGRLFNGLCQSDVRPCATNNVCGFQVLSRGHIVGWDGDHWSHDGKPCGCQPLSRVLLPGYPVREIVEVLIDGVSVDPDTYRVDQNRWLVRVRDPDDPDTVLLWPACQQMDLDPTQEGTFSVTYLHGQDPPRIAQEAAKELACQIYLGCTGSQECQLPQGTTRITRQGVTIERTFFARDPVTHAWRTGLALVDTFLNSVNPHGLTRRPVMMAPGQRRNRYAQSTG